MREIQSQLWWINSPQLTTTICSLKQWLTRSSGLCVCLRVCTCMRACACGRVCVPAHADVYVQVCMCVCESVRLRVCLNMCVYVSGGVCACACVSESECVHLCEGVYVHVWVICGHLRSTGEILGVSALLVSWVGLFWVLSNTNCMMLQYSMF